MSGAPAGSRHFPFPLPDGWFPVAYSDELGPGGIRALRYFGSDLVLWRGEDGAARVFDAFCPHLGAHLGHGGRVTGDTLRCPFHGWRFDGAGACVEVPYAKRIPPRARVRAWPVCEKNGLVAVWHHSRREPPGWEIPDVPEYGSPEWTPFERREWTVRSRNQELAENTVDQAHFKYVHGTGTVAETEFRTDGPVLEVVSKSKMETPRGVADGRIEIHAHGFGFGVTRFRGIVETLLITAGTPIDLESVHMRLCFSVRKLANSDATKGVGRAFMAEVEKQFSEDIPIWENKVHWEKPLLCDGDGPIALLRSWGRQFYSA